MAKVVTLGEIMLRLSSPGQKRFIQSDTFDVVYGGGEANVAVSAANYGHEAYFVTKVIHTKSDSAQLMHSAVMVYTQISSHAAATVSAFISSRPVLQCVLQRLSMTVPEALSLRLTRRISISTQSWKAHNGYWSGITPAISDKARENSPNWLARLQSVMVLLLVATLISARNCGLQRRLRAS